MGSMMKPTKHSLEKGGGRRAKREYSGENEFDVIITTTPTIINVCS
jgi:hypothetical protein